MKVRASDRVWDFAMSAIASFWVYLIQRKLHRAIESQTNLLAERQMLR
ncbi:MAG: hypothetical protein F6K04_10555 [Leptolyngbya sp. SIO4C5]|nr:hypothetical protein [Leptolyngbya sp. SIO4C5]